MARSPPPSPSPSPSRARSRTRRSSISTNLTRASHSSSAWSLDADQKLLNLRATGLNWQAIATYFPTKTPNACRKRHERLISRRNAESWDGKAKMELLAREYIQVRREMWEILADRVGERWNVVETKCMEHGLKNLTNAARQAERRYSSSAPEEDDEDMHSSLLHEQPLDDSGVKLEDTSDFKHERTHSRSPLQPAFSPIPTAASQSRSSSLGLRDARPSTPPEHRRRPTPTPLFRLQSRPPTIASMLRSPSPSPEPLIAPGSEDRRAGACLLALMHDY